MKLKHILVGDLERSFRPAQLGHHRDREDPVGGLEIFRGLGQVLNVCTSFKDRIVVMATVSAMS